MTGKTHNSAGITTTFVTTIFINSFDNLLVDSNISSLVSLSIIYTFASWGARVPDLESMNSNLTLHNKVVAVFMEAFGLKHRDLVTHSVYSWIFFITIPVIYLYMSPYNNSFNTVYLIYCSLGFGVGIFSHWLADMLSIEGSYFFTRKQKKSYVPKWKKTVRGSDGHKYKEAIFKTGGFWEDIVKGMLDLINAFLVIWVAFIVIKNDFGLDLWATLLSILER